MRLQTWRSRLAQRLAQPVQRWVALAVWVALLAGPAVAQDVAVRDVRFGAQAETTRTVVAVSDVTDYRIFTLADPYRVVIDLAGAVWAADTGATPETQAPGAGLVTGYRQARYRQDTTRLVLHTDGPAKIANHYALAGSESRHPRIVVDLKATVYTVFAENLHTIIEGPPSDGPRDAESGMARAGSDPFTDAAVPTPAPPPEWLPSERTIVIDPGHGGRDPGAVGVSGMLEKNVVLSVGRRLARRLDERRGYDAILTRDDDTFLELRERVEIAREADADLFLSLHADAHPDAEVRGASAYTLSDEASDEEAARLARRENQAASEDFLGTDMDHNDPQVASILVDLVQRGTMNQSRLFANTLVEHFAQKIHVVENSHRFAGFVVLKAPDVPSVLVEMGYMSNPTDERRLATRAYQHTIVDQTVAAIEEHFGARQEIARR